MAGFSPLSNLLKMANNVSNIGIAKISSGIISDVIVTFLNPNNAITLVVLSIILTLIGGLIPAKKASKKDPVIALRTE